MTTCDAAPPTTVSWYVKTGKTLRDPERRGKKFYAKEMLKFHTDVRGAWWSAEEGWRRLPKKIVRSDWRVVSCFALLLSKTGERGSGRVRVSRDVV